MPLYEFECPQGHTFDAITAIGDRREPLPCEEAGCSELAKMVIAHANPGGMLDHGSARNRDNAKEGRYDPLNPNTRFMAKGRGWRK